MKNWVHLIFLLLLTAGCNPSAPLQNAVIDSTKDTLAGKSEYNNMQQTADTVQQENRGTVFFCTYLMGEKYQTGTYDSSAKNEWIVNYLRTPWTYENLFMPKGPGPNGSQWNPSNDLFIALLIPYTKTPLAFTVQLNGVNYPDAQLHYNWSSGTEGTYVWFVLPLKEWEKRLRKVENLEEKIIWPDSASYMYRPDPAQVLKITLIDKQIKPAKKFDGYFRAAFGE